MEKAVISLLEISVKSKVGRPMGLYLDWIARGKEHVNTSSGLEGSLRWKV